VPLGIGKRNVLGLLVLEVANNSMASEAGLSIGDILIGACGQYFRTPDDLFAILQSLQTGEHLPLEFLRSGKLRRSTVNISRQRGKTPQPVMTSPSRMERS
jgi:type II secretory pathway component PulC